MQHKRLLQNVSASAIASLLYLATRFFIPPFVLGHVGIESYGLYGTAFILVAYLGVSAIGFSNAYVKYVAQYAAAGQTDRANRLLSSGFTLSSGVGILGFAGLVALWPAVSHWMKVPAAMASDARFLVFTVTGVFFAYLALSVYRDALTGVQEIALTQKVWVASFLVETAFIFALVGAGFGLRGMGLAFVARNAVELGGQWWMARQRIPWLRVRLQMPDRDSLRLLGSFGGIVQLNCLLGIFLGSVERVIATPLLGLSAAGLLDLGKRFPGMATSIPSAFVSSVLPSAAALRGDKAEGDARGLYLTTARYMNTVSGMLFGFLCFAAAPCLVFWLKKVPEGAVVLLIAFSISSQIHMLTGPGTSILKANGKPWMEFHYSIANCIALALFVPASRLLVGHWDLTAIAVAVALSTITSACWFMGRAHRKLGVSLRDFMSDVALPGLLPWMAAAVSIAPFAAWAARGDRLHAAAALLGLGGAYLVLSAVLLMAFAATNGEKSAARLLASRVSVRFQTSPQVLPAAATAE